jgi:4-amino-4-deoxy-L-arabinose transferase-like glycosyltransferase
MSSSDASTHGTARAGSHDIGNELLLDAPREKSVSIGFSLSLLIIAFIVRLAIGWSMSGSLDSDPDAYATLAKTWAQTGTYGLIDQAGVAHPTAYRPAMYPWILSWFILATNWKTWIVLLHACLGAMTAYWTFAVGHRLRLGKFISLLAMSFVLFDPILLRQATLVMTETLATWFAMGIWWTYLLGISTSRTRRGAWFVAFWSVL